MNHPPTYIRAFSLHKVRKNCNFLDHPPPPTPMSLRNIKMANTVQILTNDIQVLILCLSYFITTALSKVKNNCDSLVVFLEFLNLNRVYGVNKRSSCSSLLVF